MTAAGLEPGALVSVVVPVFNGARFLPAAVDSIRVQTYTPLEIVVVDDGSTDGTAEVARRLSGIRYAWQAHQGIGAARNRGVAMARGEVLAFLDADDLWLPDKLARQTAILREEPAVDVVFGHVEEFVDEGTGQEAGGRPGAVPRAVRGLIPSAMAARRASFDRVGPFETHWRVGEFASWLLRAGEAGLAIRVPPDVVARRRVHGENHGIRQREALQDYARILKQSLDRRRAGGPE
jgi:glycosyltransferase involved in cell wall biosynthesis